MNDHQQKEDDEARPSLIKRMLIMLGGVILLVALVAFGFYLHVQNLIASAPQQTAQTVSTIKAGKLDWQPQFTALGSVVAVRGVEVTTEVAGLVREVNIESGTTVEAGEMLLQLNADEQLAQLHSLQVAADLSATTLERDKEQLAAAAVSQAIVDNLLCQSKI